MSELRVDNILSEDGSAAPIYSKGMNIGVGVTLTCDGNFVVGGATSIAGTVEVDGLFKANTLTPLTGDTVTISSGKFLAVGGGVTVTNAGTFTVSGPTSFQSGAVVTGVVTFTEADLQANLSVSSIDVGSNIKLGNAGVITATSFSGDGSGLTGIDATTIVNGTSNVTVAASGDITATRAGTTRLTVNSTGIDVNGTVTCDGLTCDEQAVFNRTADWQVILKDNDSTGSAMESALAFRDSADTTYGYLGYTSNTNEILILNQERNAELRFGTNATGRCRITADGHFTPVNGNQYDIGSSTEQWRNAYFDGTVNTDALTVDATSTFTGDATFNGGTSAVTIGGNSDIRFTNGNWTGNSGTQGKIQMHDNSLYIAGGSSGIIFREDGTDRCLIDTSGHFRPAANNTYDLGTSAARWRNIYTNDLNLSNEGSANDVDGTWGDWTIQEGENDLFIINRRNGKKFKINLTEVN